MSTSNTASPVAQTNDAENRVWASDLAAQIGAYLTQTADTGQINLATFTRATSNTAAGYEIYRMNDTMQATAPVFFKFEYGSGGAQDRPAVWVTIGTGSNGSGAITGTFFPRTIVSSSNSGSLVSTVTNFPSFWCGVDGFFGMAFKIGAYGSIAGASAVALLVFQRTVDSSGTPTAEGALIHYGGISGGPALAYSANFGTTAVFGPANTYALVPFGVTTAVIGAGTQEFGHIVCLPEMRRALFTLTALQADIGDLVTFSATPVGVTAHTYLQLGNCAGGASAASLTAHRLCMMYE